MKRVCQIVAMLGLGLNTMVVADTVTLKDGTVTEGSVTRYEKGRFTVEGDGEKPRLLRTTDIESIDFVHKNEGGPKPAQAAPAAGVGLSGDQLDAWKLARSHIATNHDDWMPDNAMPSREAVQSTPTGDYDVYIPVVTKPEQGFGQQYGVYRVQVTMFGTSLRVDGDTFQKTNGPYRPQVQPRKKK